MRQFLAVALCAAPALQPLLKAVFCDPLPSYDPLLTLAPRAAAPPIFLFSCPQSTSWGSYSLVAAERRLLEAAVSDPANQFFVLLSETTAPLYPATLLWQQLINEQKSKINACEGVSLAGWRCTVVVGGGALGRSRGRGCRVGTRAGAVAAPVPTPTHPTTPAARHEGGRALATAGPRLPGPVAATCLASDGERREGRRERIAREGGD